MTLFDIPGHLKDKYGICMNAGDTLCLVGGFTVSNEELKIICSWGLEDLPMYAVDHERCWKETSLFRPRAPGESTSIRRHENIHKPIILCRLEAGI